MKHSPTAKEQETLDLLLERLAFDFVPIRLTNTMLTKSIIDARGPLRAYLTGTGLVDFLAIPQGSAHKVQVQLPLVTSHDDGVRKVSFYRPNTKQGDPRVWIERLGSVAESGDLLAFAFSGPTAVAFLVRGDAEQLAARLAHFLPSRFEERGRIEATISRLMRMLAPVRGEWIKTRRAGPTGVGYTLESLLGIEANVRQAADIDGVELKAYRKGALTGPGKLVTLFSKTPNWQHPDQGVGLLRKYGYRDVTRGRRALYCTVVRTRNSLGWQLQSRVDERRILVAHEAEVAMNYTFATLESRLREKHPATLFIQASSRGSGWGEEFLYEDFTFCRSPSFSNFLDLVDEDFIGLDLTLSERPSGGARDHGYLWRVRESKIGELFAYRKSLV